jgi:hypothetical protein
MGLYRKKPVVIEARQFEGGAAQATPIIDWVLAGNGTATWLEDGALLADPNCPTPAYHETHRYCPSCAFTTESEHLNITTLEGVMKAEIGDWIIKGVQGEFYPCKPDIFDATYEVV